MGHLTYHRRYRGEGLGARSYPVQPGFPKPAWVRAIGNKIVGLKGEYCPGRRACCHLSRGLLSRLRMKSLTLLAKLVEAEIPD